MTWTCDDVLLNNQSPQGLSALGDFGYGRLSDFWSDNAAHGPHIPDLNDRGR